MIINSLQEYREVFQQFDELTATDVYEQDPTLVEKARLMAQAISDYEDVLELMPIPFPAPKPTTLPAMIELKRQQRQLKQKDLAQLLEVPAGRLSQILSGKRRVTMDLAKKLYERLDISPEFILKTA
ncbi:MAG: XRE family transcriptional regulator [Hymenobacter sp.]|nr:MAG: XRE family transcriptional regulator [Hymenobacter sp.]